MPTMKCDLKKLRASEVMKTTVQWANPTENLRAAAARMAKHRIRALLVPGSEQGDLPGILSGKDIVNLIGSHDIGVLDQLHVEDATTRPAICVPATANVFDCINLMRMSGVRRLPVLDGTDVVGVLSMSDVLDRLLNC